MLSNDEALVVGRRCTFHRLVVSIVASAHTHDWIRANGLSPLGQVASGQGAHRRRYRLRLDRHHRGIYRARKSKLNDLLTEDGTATAVKPSALYLQSPNWNLGGRSSRLRHKS